MEKIECVISKRKHLDQAGHGHLTESHYRIEELDQHYERFWGASLARLLPPPAGTQNQLPARFRVLKYYSGARQFWVYATAGMSEGNSLELHLLTSAEEDAIHVETLSAVAHYHLFGHEVRLGDSVNIGRPWLPGSSCTRGLLSLPYLDGPDLEYFHSAGCSIRCLWLIPVTESEIDFRRQFGTEALEERLERAGFNYLDPARQSVV